MRVLLITNLVYGFALPVVEIFVAAYVLRNSNDVKLVVAYQLSVYTGIPFTFLLNGFLMQCIKMSRLYACGMLLSGISMAIMMLLGPLNLLDIIFIGFLMGMSFGLYWANRDFLALASTNDSNRNYYYSLENFFATNISIVVPLAVGSFIAAWTREGWFGGRVDNAYKIVTLGIVLLTMVASYIIHFGQFQNPPPSKFVYFRFHRLWIKLQCVAVLRGLTSGYIVTAPSMLIMLLLGKEASIGIIQSTGAALSAIILYIIGRTTGPKHRIYLYIIGVSLFAIGTLPNAVLFNGAGVIFFMLCLLLARPLTDIAYFTMQMLVIDRVSEIERRNTFAYILNQELGYYIGRASGCILFIVLAYEISNNVALRYALPIVALLQLASALFVKSICYECSVHGEASRNGSPSHKADNFVESMTDNASKADAIS